MSNREKLEEAVKKSFLLLDSLPQDERLQISKAMNAINDVARRSGEHGDIALGICGMQLRLRLIARHGDPAVSLPVFDDAQPAKFDLEAFG